MPVDAKGCRIVISKAVDDTGVDLALPESSAAEFRAARVNEMFTLKLKSPDRKAGHIQELSGNVEVFVPSNDSAATVTIDWSQKQVAIPIRSEALKSAAVELTAWTADQYNAYLKNKEAEDLKDSEAKERAAIKTLQEREAQLPVAVQEKGIANIKAAFATGREAQALGRRKTMAPKSNDVVFSIKDPGRNLVGIEFRDPLNMSIKSTGTSEFYQQRGTAIEHERTYHFDAPVPPTGKLVIFVATPQSLTRTPFELRDIALP